MIKLSIITINLNNLEGLQRTMQSVLSQSFTDYEYMIIDGGSTDGSKEEINKYENSLVYWISEKDKGIYNAMNKGILASKGEYLLFLNSGDFFISKTGLHDFFSHEINEDLVYCDILWSVNGEIVNGDFPQLLTFRYFSNASLPHQATFIRKELFEKVGLYDESLKITSDWKFFLLAIFQYNCTYSQKNIVLVQCDREGISCDPSYWPLIVLERQTVLKENFPQFIKEIEIYNEEANDLKKRIKHLEKDQKMLGLRLHKKINKFLKRN